MNSPKSKPTTLVDMWEKTVSRFPNHLAFDLFGKKVSYRKAGKLVDNLAASLFDLGIHHGDRVAILLPNCPQWTIAFYAAVKIGAIVVPCNPLYKDDELKSQIQNARPKAIVTLDIFHEQVARIRTDIKDSRVLRYIIATSLSEFLGAQEKISRVAHITALKIKLPWSDKKTAASWKKEIEEFQNFVHAAKHIRAESEKYRAVTHLFSDMTKEKRQTFPSKKRAFRPPSADSLATLIYTGGTTGNSKGAMLSHENRVASLCMTAKWFTDAKIGEERFLVAPPLFHTMALTLLQDMCVALCGEMIFVPKATDLPSLVKIISKERPTILVGPPRLAAALITFCKKGLDLSFVKFFISGGAELPKHIAEEWEKVVVGVPLIQGYGLTEAMPTHCNPRFEKRKNDSIGLPFSGTTDKIMVENFDGSFDEAASGEIGELWIKGPQVMKGYWNAPKETANAFHEGWFRTGDLVCRDKDGYLFFVEREKDLIVTDSGFNVYPKEVQEKLRDHPAVLDCAVIGVSERKGKTDIKAFIVLKEGRISTKEEMMHYCEEHMVEYKVPRYIEFLDALPISAVGKTLHRKLRDK